MICPDCGKEHTRPNIPRGAKYQWRCEGCSARRASEKYLKNREARIASQRKWAKENPEKIKENSRRQSLRRKCGISQDDYTARLNAQGGVCLICGAGEKKMAVDHNHETGKVRGILCMNCNLMVGHSGESALTLERAAKYLAA